MMLSLLPIAAQAADVSTEANLRLEIAGTGGADVGVGGVPKGYMPRDSCKLMVCGGSLGFIGSAGSADVNNGFGQTSTPLLVTVTDGKSPIAGATIKQGTYSAETDSIIWIVSPAGKTTSSFSDSTPIVKVSVDPEDTFEINVTYDRTNVTVKKGDALTLTATHDIPSAKLGTVTYQWYSNTTNYVGTSAEIPGETNKIYTVPTSTEGVKYYFCEVTNVKDDKTTSSFSDSTPMVKVTVENSAYVFPFKDVYTSDWFYSDVVTANKNGLINGKSTTIFSPNDNMTIAEAVKLAACMHQLYHDGKVTLENGPGATWYSTYMAYALANKIIDFDMSDSADSYIVRQEFVYIFYAALPASEYTVINSVKDNAIPDVKFMSTAQFPPRIYAFYRAGILIGSDSAGTFNPHSNILRSEVAAILTRMFDASARKSITLG